MSDETLPDAETRRDPRPQSSWRRRIPHPGGGKIYGEMIDALRTLLDTLSDAKPDEATSAALAASFRGWNETLAPMAVPEAERVFGRRFDLPGRGQVLAPPYTVEERAPGMIKGSVVFGRFYLGANDAVYGGALPLLFDEVLAIIANEALRKIARTACLRVDYRSVVPIGRPLQFHGWIEREEGRKRWVRGTITDCDRLCAEAEALFVELKPGQP